ncbi:MAG TPA: orotidine-5'-phosphate decarboxylase [Candidatus Paceibacterota bacterium]|nr:orotidine-5'-phosphate decarboxylase [Candidatus Paceibacterota bacterium]
MGDRNFRSLLESRWSAGKFVCVGLDSDYAQIPESVRTKSFNDIIRSIVTFNAAIVNATSTIVCAYKPNIASYAGYGAEGIAALQRTIQYIHNFAPEIPVILDAKRGDIGSTNAGYVREAFEYFQADAITLHPYLGAKALQPFLDRDDKGIFILCRTSNPGAGEFQDLQVGVSRGEIEFLSRCHATGWSIGIPGCYAPMYLHVACQVSIAWNKNGNCGVVVGATYPHELRNVRNVVDGTPILIPGIGAQGGDVKATVSAAMDSRGAGMIINSSRGIIFASHGEDFAEAARRETLTLHNLITQCREELATR